MDVRRAPSIAAAIILCVIVSADSDARQPIGIAQSSTPPRPLAGKPSPVYPAGALTVGLEGDASFRADVSAAGYVTLVTVLTVPRPGVGFEEAIRSAVKQWRFEPATRDGVAVDGVYLGKFAFVSRAKNIGRMFPVPSRTAWQAVVAWTRQARLKTDIVDDRNQLLQTQWISADASQIPTGLDAGSIGTRLQVQVFVSPFVEPARVYVATVVEWGRATDESRDRYRSYNVPDPSTWLLDALAHALGSTGVAIPDNDKARAELAQTLRPDLARPCTTSSSSAMIPPKRITSPQPIYPTTAQVDARQGKVTVSGLVREDGTFGSLQQTPAVGTDPELFTSARAALTLWHYQPLMLAGCPRVAMMTVTVEFVLR